MNHPHGSRQADRDTGSRSRTPGLFAYVCACFLLVALAYAGGRWHAAWAQSLYWLGEVLLLVGVGYRAVLASASGAERTSAVLMYSAAQSAISWAYSPDRFRHSDELQHLRSLLNLLHFHHGLHTNYSLPISPHFPGLENTTAAVVQTTSLSLFASGLIVVGVAHLLLSASLLSLYRRLTHSERTAAAGALIYLLGTDQAVTRLFLYEALALPFLVLALRLSVEEATQKRASRVLAVLALACIGVVTITHHVTAIAGVLLVGFLGAGLVLLRSSRRMGRQVLSIALGGMAIVAAWIGFFAPQTISYLGGPLAYAAYGAFAGLGSGTGAAAGTSPGGLERALSLSGPALTIFIVPVGVWLLYRRKPHMTMLIRVWAVGSLSFFGVLAIRVAGANGSELSGRSLTYSSLFSALVIGFVLAFALPERTATRRSAGGTRWWMSVRMRQALTGTGILILGVSGLISAIPPAYERLPGTFHVAGAESGIDAENIAAAQWAAPNIGPGHRIFGDFTAYTLWSALGNQETVHGDVALVRAYEAPVFRPEDVRAVTQLDVRYFETDLRMTGQSPVTGTYFAAPDNDLGHARTSPLPPSALSKFDRVPGISGIYDNGNIRLYDLRGSPYAP